MFLLPLLSEKVTRLGALFGEEWKAMLMWGCEFDSHWRLIMKFMFFHNCLLSGWEHSSGDVSVWHSTLASTSGYLSYVGLVTFLFHFIQSGICFAFIKKTTVKAACIYQCTCIYRSVTMKKQHELHVYIQCTLCERHEAVLHVCSHFFFDLFLTKKKNNMVTWTVTIIAIYDVQED